MKKLAVIITIASVLSLCACGKGNKENKEDNFEKLAEAELALYDSNYTAVVNYNHVDDKGDDVAHAFVRLKTDGTRNFNFAIAENDTALESTDEQLGYFASVNYCEFLLNYYQIEGAWFLGTDYYQSIDEESSIFFEAFDNMRGALSALEAYYSFIKVNGNTFTLENYEDEQSGYIFDVKVEFENDFVKSTYLKSVYKPTGDVWTVTANVLNVGQNKIDAPVVDAFDLQVKYAIAAYSAYYQTMSIDYSFKLTPVEKPEDALLIACVLEVNCDGTIYHLTYDDGEEYFEFVMNGEGTDCYYYYMDEGAWTYKIDNSKFETELGLIFNTLEALYGFESKEFIDAIKGTYQKQDDNSYTYKLSDLENNSGELDISIVYDDIYNTLTSIEAQGQMTISMFEESLECYAEYSIGFTYGEFEEITLPEILS